MGLGLLGWANECRNMQCLTVKNAGKARNPFLTQKVQCTLWSPCVSWKISCVVCRFECGHWDFGHGAKVAYLGK